MNQPLCYRAIPVYPVLRAIVCPQCGTSIGPDNQVKQAIVTFLADGRQNPVEEFKFKCLNPNCGTVVSVGPNEGPGLVFSQVPPPTRPTDDPEQDTPTEPTSTEEAPHEQG